MGWVNVPEAYEDEEDSLLMMPIHCAWFKQREKDKH